MSLSKCMPFQSCFSIQSLNLLNVNHSSQTEQFLYVGLFSNAFDVSTSTFQVSAYPPGASCGITPGGTCFSTSTSTLDQGWYNGTLSLTDVNGQSFLLNVAFTIGSTGYIGVLPPSSGILPPGGGYFVATGTPGVESGNLLSFLNVPSLLQTRLPFAYLFQIAPAIRSAMSTSTQARAITSINIPYKLSSSMATSSWTIFSTSTVTTYLNGTPLDLLRALLGAITYLGTMWYLYHDARHKKHLF